MSIDFVCQKGKITERKIDKSRKRRYTNTIDFWANLERKNPMYTADELQMNQKGELTIGGVAATELAKTYGTPLYVMDEDKIRTACRTYRDAIEKYYDGNGLVLYASKAFCCKQMCRIANEEGLGIDVVSGGELYTAIASGFPMERVYFHGNNKSDAELEMAVEHQIGCVIIDNEEELLILNEICKQRQQKMRVMFRIKPGVEAHTHEFVQTGQLDSKFGVALKTGEAFELLKKAFALQHVEVLGIHCHIGSQIFDLSPFELAAQRMMELIVRVKNELGQTIRQLNLGGGFGIQYEETDDPIPYDSYIESVSKVIKSYCSKHQIPLPFILMEPGRSIVGPAGYTLYTVGAIKEIPGIRTYLSVDGGLSDNPRFILYGARYRAVIANRVAEAKTKTYTISGKCCESGDIICDDVRLQEAKRGDCLCVLATGAYNYSMSSNYNRIKKPAVVMVQNGKHYLAVKAETFEDLIRNDL